MPIVQPPPKIAERTYVTEGLVDQDDKIDLLTEYFKEMQKTTVETSQPDDFLSFASCAHFFGIVMLETTTTPMGEEYASDDEAEGEVAPGAPPEEAEESIYPASSRATSPPESTTWGTSDHQPSQRLQMLRETAFATASESLLPTLSEEEKVLLWREAFMAKIEETSDEPLVPMHHEPGVRPIYSNKGKFPELGSPTHPDTEIVDALQADEDAEIGSDFINWPDEGPSSGDAHTGGLHQADDPYLGQNDDFLYMDVTSPTVPMHEEAIGRELLEPEVYTSPAMELAELPPDPAMQVFVYESALKFQHSLREKRVKEYLVSQRRQKRNRLSNLKPPAPPTTTNMPIGLIYLWTSQTFLDPLHMGECSLGIYIVPEHRGKGCLLDAVDKVVKLAFRDPECHRLQSIIVDHPDKLYNLELLARAGFRNEGIRRRAFFSSSAYEWKDVTYFAMLVTDWVYDNNNDNPAVRLRTNSLWDEVFARHQKECDDLIRLEEKSSLKRSCSIETIRERVSSSLSVTDSDRDDGNTTDTASSIRSSVNAKRRRMGYQLGQWRPGGSSAASTSSGLGSQWEVASSVASSVPSMSAFGAPRSTTSSLARLSSGSGSGSSSSQWDVL